VVPARRSFVPRSRPPCGRQPPAASRCVGWASPRWRQQRSAARPSP
jgi:hypothetical protein